VAQRLEEAKPRPAEMPDAGATISQRLRIGSEQPNEQFRIALANIRFPTTPEESVLLVEQAIAHASMERADLVCFPECYVPGYRAMGKSVPPPDPAFLERAWSASAAAAAQANVSVILGTERVVKGSLLATAMVINRDGSVVGFQDKVQLDTSEERTYSFGSGRRVFQAGSLTFGITICHEGWRYPETVRWAVRRGAQIVFHPHFHEAEPGGYVPSVFAHPANSFHEKLTIGPLCARGLCNEYLSYSQSQSWNSPAGWARFIESARDWGYNRGVFFVENRRARRDQHVV
jgi:predicted amidohydrolase